MKHDVTRSCGHPEKVKVYGTDLIMTKKILSDEARKKCKDCDKHSSHNSKGVPKYATVRA